MILLHINEASEFNVVYIHTCSVTSHSVKSLAFFVLFLRLYLCFVSLLERIIMKWRLEENNNNNKDAHDGDYDNIGKWESIHNCVLLFRHKYKWTCCAKLPSSLESDELNRWDLSSPINKKQKQNKYHKLGLFIVKQSIDNFSISFVVL